MNGSWVVRSAVFATLCLGSHVSAQVPAAPAAQAAKPVAAAAPAATVAPAATAPVAKPAAVAAAAAPSAAAAPAAPAPVMKPEAARAEVLQTAKQRLASGDDANVRAALQTLSELGGDPAAEAIVARLHRGLPPQLIELAIDSLVLLHRPSAAPALLELAQHRRAPIRARAIGALGALHARNAQSALLFALDDPSPDVRSAAALALGAVGNARALPALWAAADRGVEHALDAVASLATPAEVKTVLGRAHEGDITPVKAVLQGLMARKTFPLDAKVNLVRALQKLGTPSARACLVQWLDERKTEGEPRLRQALFAAIKQIDSAHAPIKFESAAAPGAKP